MVNLRTVRIPLLERVVLEELASRWQVTTDEALSRVIRRAAQQEVIKQPESLIDARGLSRSDNDKPQEGAGVRV